MQGSRGNATRLAQVDGCGMTSHWTCPCLFLLFLDRLRVSLMALAGDKLMADAEVCCRVREGEFFGEDGGKKTLFLRGERRALKGRKVHGPVRTPVEMDLWRLGIVTWHSLFFPLKFFFARHR